MIDKTAPAIKLLQADSTQLDDQDELGRVLTILRILKKQVSSPVVRECLEAARSDIAHLAGPVGAGDDDDEDGDVDDRDDEDE